MSNARLYLLTPPLGAAEGFVERFAAALGAGDVASVLVRLAAGADAKRIIAPLLDIAAAHDTALLIEGDGRLAARLGVDGVHVDAAEVADALASCRPERIVGAGGLHLRDDAMSAAEAGVDYVMFGEPGAALSPEATRERVSWWAEIFEAPCVVYAPALEDVAALAAAGADFVALDAAVWDAEDVAEAVRAAVKNLRRSA
jgi:thiamine-phosphate pyrophosphorylase